MSAEDIVKKLSYRSNAVLKKAGEATRSVSKVGHSIYSVFDGQAVKRVRRNEAVKQVALWLDEGYMLASEIVEDIVP